MIEGSLRKGNRRPKAGGFKSYTVRAGGSRGERKNRGVIKGGGSRRGKKTLAYVLRTGQVDLACYAWGGTGDSKSGGRGDEEKLSHRS